MGHMKYGFGGMESAHGSIGSATGKLNQIESDINGALARLRGAWTEGSDLEAYTEYQRTWGQIFQDVHLALAGLGRVVSTATDNARQTESTNTKMFTP